MENLENHKKRSMHGKIIEFCDNFTKPSVARKLAVRHTKLVCVTSSFLAILIISKCMHGLQASLFKYSTGSIWHLCSAW